MVINIVHTLIFFCCMLSSSHVKNVYWYFVFVESYIFVLLLLAIVLSVLRYTDSDYPFVSSNSSYMKYDLESNQIFR